MCNSDKTIAVKIKKFKLIFDRSSDEIENTIPNLLKSQVFGWLKNVMLRKEFNHRSKHRKLCQGIY